jgi:signal transduction histidine kinase/DNA-binding response OmpR family regulator/ligand-binding sensor domain-containing protein
MRGDRCLTIYFYFRRIFFFLISILFGLLLGFLPLNLFCQGQEMGVKYITNYTPKDYNNSPQNWCIVQDKRGIIYAGNGGGLLEYDGVSWRLITIPNSSVFSLAADDAGTVYIGGFGEIGFLMPDSKGALQYVSLRQRLTEDQKDFTYVWKICPTKEGVYFQSRKFLFKWDGKEKKIKVMEKNVNALFDCGGELYIRQDEIGLQQKIDDSFELIPGGEKFAKKIIFMMVPFQDDSKKLLIGTKENGLFSYNDTKVEMFKTEADEYLKANKLHHGIRLSSGDFAIATSRGGLVIIDSNGGLKYIFNEDSGLQDNDVSYVIEDKQGNLWLSLGNGISKIEYNSPISIYNKQSKLPGLVLSISRHGPGRILYVGTTRGLYSLPSPFKTFRPVPGIPGYCWSLLSIGESLLAATDKGVFQVTNKDKPNVITDQSYVLHRSHQDKNRIWVGTGSGLVSLYFKNGQWNKESKFEKIEGQIRTIVEDKGNLWLGTLPKRVTKVNLPGDADMMNSEVTVYDTSHGLPGGWVYAFTAAGHPIFATRRGIYRFNKETDTFIPDYTLGEDFAGGPKGRSVFRIVEDRNKGIWFSSDNKNYRTIPREDGTFDLKKKPFLRIPPAQVNIIYPDPDGDSIWIGSDDGLIRFDKTVKKNYKLKFKTFIRKVVANGKLISDGYPIKPGGETESQHKHTFPIFDYKDRNLYFEFAAPSFEAEIENQYQYWLMGYDENWSGWTPEPQKEYTNLDSGLYTFRVQAKNIYMHPGSEDVFKFRILPPWYKTWWAFLFYFLIAVLLVVSIVRWRSGKLEREKQRLERIVGKRTKEIEEKNQQLENQTLKLKEQSEKLKEMDRVKSRFFANISHEFRTPLTLIMGPLEQMLSACRDEKQQKSLNLMLRNSQRLLGLINQLLELCKFESGKMKLQASPHNIIPFLKGIAASFEPTATKNDLALTFHSEEEDVNLYFDPGKLEEVIFNLLSNAVKFTPPGGQITIKVTKNHTEEEDFPSGSLDISVCDTGPGIPRDQLAHIFERFYQSDITYEHHLKGSGIGLAIAKEMVEFHHGRIDVHSSKGKGTEFIIRLPIGKAHLKPEEIVEISEPPAPRKTPPEIKTFYMPGNGEREENGPAEAEPDSTEADTAETRINEKHVDALEFQKSIILVVENSADVRDYIREALEPHYIVADARNGSEGIQKAKEIIPDLIISDIMMPGTDGYELCRTLKNDVNISHIPIILLTAKASEESIIQGLETGADDYITKPFNTRILCVRIKNLIDLRRHMQDSLKREMTLQPAKISVTQVDKTFLKKLKEVINQNISDPEFNIDQLCRILDMSQPTLYRKIHALTGESPTDFIRSFRLKRGAELLKENFGTVLEVAFEVGFSSASYFTKCFKRKFHYLPSTYKESEG